jgi:NADPH:quinone reductase-like Zn-dependent oxidoreductase
MNAKRWSASKYGSDFSSLEIEEVSQPGDPGQGELVVEVGAAALAATDLLLLSGGYPGMEHLLPHPIGLEYAGTVSVVGPGVTKVAVGDRVCGVVYPPQGAAGQYVVVAETDVGVIPSHFSLEEGAAIPSAYMTAHDALHRHGSLRRGERVLVLAAAGGLGIASIQVASLAGADVYGAASGAKLDAVRAAGAVEAYDYTVDGWEQDLEPFDLILDPIGGESFARSYAMLGPGGRLACLDALSRYPRDGETEYRQEPGDPSFNPLQLIGDGKSIVGINMPLLWPQDGGMAPLLEDAISYFEADGVRPVIAKAFEFDDLVAALRYVEERRNVGRVILKV